MQRIRPAQGPHNPLGRSEADILAALRGMSGARRLTFRYELLDRSNVVLRELDEGEVASCRIQQNWLATIKRTADFRIRTDGRGLIDWLSDRIKPWVRLHLPPYGPQDWVEWPQGVFLLTAPSREADESGTVWRDVEGYDQLQALDDDQIPTRLSTADLIQIQDQFVRDTTGAWGTADTGQTWTDTTAASTTLGTSSSDGGYGFVTLGAAPSTIRGQYIPLRFQDVDIRTRFAVSHTATGESLLPAVIMRWSGSNFYRMRVRFTTAGTVQLDVTRNSVQIGAAESPGLSYTPGAWINVRARVVGQTVQGRVWADGAREPAEWGIERDIVTDPIATGVCGLAASAFGSNTNTSPQLRYGRFDLDDNPTGLVTMAVHHMLAIQAGIRQVAITPSTEALSRVREWEPGTSKLAIINDLLDSIAYESLSFDESGTAVVQPYVSPQERPPEYTYADDHESVMLPDVVQERDLHAIPNRWVASSGEPDEEPITVVFTNTDPASPTSTVRRGRVITRFDDEEEATSEPAMIEKVARLAFEGSQVYEAVEFQTALMPIHSGNDVYDIRFDPLAIGARFSEHTWDMDLDAGAMMHHRARRVISLSPASDPSIVVGDVTVDGALEAGNVAFGVELVTPVANTPTPHVVTGLALKGSGPVRVQVSPLSAVPGSTFIEASIRNPTPDGFTIWVYRTNTTATNVHWLAIRGA
jgi:hypothetical protein